jgi:hypothetical protein
VIPRLLDAGGKCRRRQVPVNSMGTLARLCADYGKAGLQSAPEEKAKEVRSY